MNEKHEPPPWLIYLFNSWPLWASIGFVNSAAAAYLMREGAWVPLWYRVPAIAVTGAVASFGFVRCKRIAKNTFRRPKPDLPVSPSPGPIPPENSPPPNPSVSAPIQPQD